jgi:hypothetical protein
LLSACIIVQADGVRTAGNFKGIGLLRVWTTLSIDPMHWSLRDNANDRMCVIKLILL